MKSIYSNPLRVYLVLGILALYGIFCGTSLSISLFPNSSKPVMYVKFPLENITSQDFLKNYGMLFESDLMALQTSDLKVTRIEASYESTYAQYIIHFEWETDPAEARKEVENSVHKITLQLSENVRRNTQVYPYSENGGFFAASLSHPQHDANELFKLLEPILAPQLRQVQDAQDLGLRNPMEKSVILTLNPDALLRHQFLPIDIQRALQSSLQSYQGGSVDLAGKSMQIVIQSAILKPEDLRKIQIVSRKGVTLQLSDLAQVDFAVATDNIRIFKTNGMSSLIIFGMPKIGGNIKKMAEDTLEILKKNEPSFPPGTDLKILVDPSEFIRSSISHVITEVFLAAGLAVIILFLFIGQLKNVVTAAIEIPLSIILAFILMKLFDINLNLISLGGLALSAGMNVDASVVVMENIFRYFGKVKEKLTNDQKLELVIQAVNEVKMPIIASTIASVVVFFPLIFTQGLSSALLGDLAKAVIFSHSLSAVVALILVPTVRLQMMKTESVSHTHSPLENSFQKLENFYVRALEKFLASFQLKVAVYFGLFAFLGLLMAFMLPKIPKEVIGKPITDWIIVIGFNNENTLLRQMESQSEEIESQIVELLPEDLNYTFTQINSPNRTQIMVRLKNKRRMAPVKKILEDHFTNTPTTRFLVIEWNPSELPLPESQELKIAVRGANTSEILTTTENVKNLIQEKEYYRSVYAQPDVHHSENISIRPHPEIWSELTKTQFQRPLSDLSDYLQVATNSKTVGYMNIENQMSRVTMQFPQSYVKDAQSLGALPLVIGDKIVPIKAVMNVQILPSEPSVFRVNQSSQYYINGYLKDEEKSNKEKYLEDIKSSVQKWQQENPQYKDTSIQFEDGEFEVNDSIRQLSIAFSLSLLLIFLTMVLQMGNVMNSLLVLAAIPLGFIGVILSLFIFQSTVSLNSMLGIILLNGIAVANSIILVDFIQRQVDEGMSPLQAALHSGQARLRPILMTTLTTLLGMTPIALGLGEGGKILQPLGISVIGGLGVSTLLTLFIVPALQTSYLQFKIQRDMK